MAQVVGQRTTNQGITETRVIRQVDEKIGMLEPNVAPLITMLMKVAQKTRKPVKSPRVEWFEDDYVSRWAQNSGDTVAANASSTTVTVTDGTLFNAGTVFNVPQAVTSAAAPEVVRVASVAGNVLTVVRNIGGTGLVAINDGAAIRILGTAYEEGGSIPSALTTAPVAKINYTQIFRTVIDMSRTNINTEHYGAQNSDERKRLHEKKLKEHKIWMNSVALFGQKSESLTGGPTGKPIRTSDGINNVISTNVYNAEGMLTQSAWEAFSRMSFRYGSETKLLLAAPMVKSAINEWAKSFLTTTEKTTSYGLRIKEIVTAHGTWNLVNDWSFENGIAGANGFAGLAFSIDLENVGYRYLQNSDTKLTENVVIDGRDAIVDEILTEACFVFKQEKTHAKLYNATSYSA